jgi:hypothetical protein
MTSRRYLLGVLVPALAVGAGVGLLTAFVHGAIVYVLVGLLLFIMLGTNRMMHHAREAGYFEARATMWSSMNEAMNRGMAFEDWLEAEMERDRMRIKGKRADQD